MSAILWIATRVKLPPWLVEVILALLLLLTFALWERHQGAASCRAEQQALADEQEAHNRDLKAQGTTTVFQEAHDFHDAISRPIERPVHLGRVCPPGREVRAASATGSVRGDETELPSTDNSDPVQTEPYGPQLQEVGRDADAQVRELQHYITNVCSKR